MSSLRPAFSEAYLTELIDSACSKLEATPGRRHLALAYTASLVARTAFLPIKYTLITAKWLIATTRELLEEAEAGANGPDQIVLLLAAVQAVCYVFCWWADAFSKFSDGESYSALDELLPPDPGERPGVTVPRTDKNFLTIIDSHHWPIQRIRRNVAKEFVKSIRPHRKALAQRLTQQLKQAPTSQCSEEESESGQVFYPFDPYRLRHSSIFLVGIYREWKPPDADSDSEDDDDPVKQQGFTQQNEDKSGMRTRAMSVLSSSELADDEDLSDGDDFTDVDDDQLLKRGFHPAVGPSPALRPKASPDMRMVGPSPFLRAAHSPDMKMAEMSPLLMPQGASGADDFLLPQASIDMNSDALSNYLDNPAYRS